jgi:hypothetical protein
VGCGAFRSTEVDTDLTRFIDDIQQACGGTFRGTVVDGERQDDEEVTYLACDRAGQEFLVTVDVGSEMECRGGELQEEADCHHASHGDLPVQWELVLGGDVALSNDTGASIINYASGVLLDCGVTTYVKPSPTAPVESFDYWPDVMSFSDRLSGFSWTKRHSEDDEDVAVWEVCELPVDESEP